MDNKNSIDEDVRELMRTLMNEIAVLKEYIANPKAVYTNKEMAELLKVDAKTLRKYRNDGLMGYSQIRDKYFYTNADLSEFLANNHMNAYYYS